MERTIVVRLLGMIGDGGDRAVTIPWEPEHSKMTVLERVWHFGQNDFQPISNRRSVSVGDVAELDGEFWKATCFGWKQLDGDPGRQTELAWKPPF